MGLYKVKLTYFVVDTSGWHHGYTKICLITATNEESAINKVSNSKFGKDSATYLATKIDTTIPYLLYNTE